MRIIWLAAMLVPLLAGEAAAGGDGKIAYLAQTDGFWQVWVADPDGENSRQVTRTPYEKVACSWFPDGEHLLVDALDGHLFQVDVASGREAPIASPPLGTADAVVSPDGSKIAYSMRMENSIDDNEIWVMAADGSNPRMLTRMDWLQHQPEWSADGRWIYFLSGDGDQAHDIFRVSVESGVHQQLTAASLYHFELALAPDGTLAYSNNRSGNYDIYVQRPGEPPRPITSDAALDGHPAWSPSGEEIIFHSMRSGEMNLWRVAVAGGTPRQITHHTGGARGPVWWHPPGKPQ